MNYDLARNKMIYYAITKYDSKYVAKFFRDNIDFCLKEYDVFLKDKLQFIFGKKKSKRTKFSECFIALALMITVPIIGYLIYRTKDVTSLRQFLVEIKELYFPSGVANLNVLKPTLMIQCVILYVYEYYVHGDLFNFIRKIFLKNRYKLHFKNRPIKFFGYSFITVGYKSEDYDEIVIIPFGDSLYKELYCTKNYLVTRASYGSIILEDYCTKKFLLTRETLAFEIVNLVGNNYYFNKWMTDKNLWDDY